MATSREERMHERLRGGRVHQVEDISFGPIIPFDEEEEVEVDPEPEPLGAEEGSPVAESDQQQSSSPRPANSAQDETGPVGLSTTEVPATSSPQDVPKALDGGDDQTRTLRSSVSQTTKKALEEVTESPTDAPGSGRRRRVSVRVSAAASQSAILQQYLSSAQRDPDHTVDSSSPAERRLRAKRLSAAGVRKVAAREVVVPESSSSRRSARLSQASEGTVDGEATGPSPYAAGTGSGAAVDELSPENSTVAATTTVTVTQSSPIARILQKTRGRGRPRISQPRVIEATSPLPDPQPQKQPTVDELSQIASENSQERNSSAGPVPRSEDTPGSRNPVDVDEATESSEAEEVNDQEAARTLGRKRPRADILDASPDLSSTTEDHRSKAAKRRRAAPPPAISPAVQQQPAPRPLKTAVKQRKLGPDRPKSKKKAAANEGEPESQRDGSIQVPVQRFTRPKHGATDEDEAEDDDGAGEITNVAIPFSSREGVNSVDVLSQLCEEVTANVLRILRNKVTQVEDTASRKEMKTKVSAVEAFREELRTNLLEHTIAIDNLQTLRRRLRAAQKEKRTLRDEILNVRREREQVALRRDALRMKHESENEKVMHRIQISSTMQDIELAIDEGRAAPELSAKEQKQAELANLELLMLRVGDRVRPNGHEPGVLDQVRSFNAYLERTAAALQGK